MEGKPPTVLVVGRDQQEAEALSAPLREAGFSTRTAHSPGTILEAIYQDPPKCLLMPHPMADHRGAPMLDEVKGDNLYGHLPVVVLIEPEIARNTDWSRNAADDYILQPWRPEELVSRVHLCLARAQRDINANPLTGLPGNVTIMREAERRIENGARFAMGYLDLDHFKPFNDKYGFARGDEVLRMTARLLVNAVRNLHSQDAYAGHIGGDDFVIVTPTGRCEQACKEIIRNFDLIVPNFYDEEDRIRGCIRSVDRQGEAREFPLLSISIAVVDTGQIEVRHLADIGARCAEVKKYAKSLPGSNYLLDRRA